MTSSQHVYEVRPRKRSSQRRSDFRCAAIRSVYVLFSSERKCLTADLFGIRTTPPFALWLIWLNESGNQKGNLSYLAGTKKRSDSLIQLIFHKRGARADEDARALFLSNTAEERVELLCIVCHRFEFYHQRRDIREVSQPLTSRCGSRLR